MTFYELLKNIINKLGLAVRTDAQTLSDEQKAQVIENIGAVSENISINGQSLSSDVTLTADDVGVYVQSEEPVNAVEGDIWVDTDAESHHDDAAKLPYVTPSDRGKFLRVSIDGTWIAETVLNAWEEVF